MDTDSPPAPKFRRRAKARPGEVLDAALALFTEQGFARTSVAQIAKRADLSKGAVYLYFPSKDAILEGLVARMIAPLSDEVFDKIAGHQGDPRPLLAQFLRMLAGMMGDETRRAVPMIVLREALAAPAMAASFRKAVLDRALPAVTALLSQGMEGDYIRPLDPELTARTVVGPIMAHIILHEVFSITPRDGLAMERLVENHLAILLAGLAPEEGVSP